MKRLTEPGDACGSAAPAQGGQTPGRRGVRREQVAAAALPAAARRASRTSTPVLLVPSLINRHYVLDLMPGKSFAEYLVAQGHDVCVHRLGHARRRGPLRHLRRRRRSLRSAARCRRSTAHAPVSQKRTCSATAWAARWRRFTARCTRSTSPRSSRSPRRSPSTTRACCRAWTRRRLRRRRAGGRRSATCPGSSCSRPSTCCGRRWRCPRRSPCSTARGTTSSSTASSRWRPGATTTSRCPGEFYRRYISELYRDDGLLAGRFTLSGRPVRALGHQLPHAGGDVRARQHRALAERGGAARRDRARRTSEHLHLAGGHVGAVVSKHAAKTLWPKLDAFFSKHDRRVATPPSSVRTNPVHAEPVEAGRPASLSGDARDFPSPRARGTAAPPPRR